jgi:hypothetical protein
MTSLRLTDSSIWDRFWTHPAAAEGFDVGKYDLNNFYTPEQIEEYANLLKEERRAHLASFPGLNPKIMEACN